MKNKHLSVKLITNMSCAVVDKYNEYIVLFFFSFTLFSPLNSIVMFYILMSQLEM